MTSASTPVPAPDAKARLLDAARALFAERGYTGTSIGRLAESAGVNRALIYYYFKNKRDLYRAVIEDFRVRIAGVEEKAQQASGGPRRRVEVFLQGYYRLLIEREDMVRIAVRELTEHTEEPDRCIGQTLMESERWLEGMIGEGVQAGEFRRVNPAMAALSLLGIMHEFMRHRLHTGRRFPLRSVVAHALGLLTVQPGHSAAWKEMPK